MLTEVTSTLSRKLQTATLPTPPVLVGCRWWNSRFHCLYCLIKTETGIQATFTSHQDPLAESSRRTLARQACVDWLRLRPLFKRVRLLSCGRAHRQEAGETHMDYICWGVPAVYNLERAQIGSHSAAAHRLGMHRNTFYGWLEWARWQVTK
jgi:hypothetical protein